MLEFRRVNVLFATDLAALKGRQSDRAEAVNLGWSQSLLRRPMPTAAAKVPPPRIGMRHRPERESGT
jgi:hypothetical protein